MAIVRQLATCSIQHTYHDTFSSLAIIKLFLKMSKFLESIWLKCLNFKEITREGKNTPKNDIPRISTKKK
jgi:hypothetical protein